MTHAGHELVHNPEQTDVDLSKEDDDESMHSKDSGSSITSGGEEDKANAPDPSTPQMKAAHPQAGMSMLPKTTEAIGFGSDTSSRTESTDNDELSQAGPN
jgi:hypothetical protein